MDNPDKWYISGPLAIGTPEPAGQLTLEGLVQPGQGRLTFFSKSADVEYDGGSDGIFLFSNTAPNGKTAFVGGNVGIGTANPSAGLEIDKGPTNDVALVLNSSGPGWGSGLQLKNTAPGGKTYGIYSGSGSLHITDADNGVDRLLIDSSGNVGIGTTSPGGKLEVAGGGGASIDLIVNGRLQSNNNDGGLWVAGDRFIGGHSTNKVGFWNGNAWRLTVQSDGNVGIGTAEPVAGKLQFDNGGGNKIVIYDNGPTDRYGLGLNSGNLNAFVPAGGRFSIRQNGHDGTEVMAVTGAGDLTIGGDISTTKGHVPVVPGIANVKIRFGVINIGANYKKDDGPWISTFPHGETFTSTDSYVVIAKASEIHTGLGNAIFTTYECKPSNTTSFMIRWKFDWNKNDPLPVMIQYVVIGT
ncbi:MAG: hypothetical protein H8K07_19285 [Nitrospira sp.]|jgi:hypothetical protein|nr:hypothetical protein [Nitrospira sp.]MDI3467828.1 hypothetical protein [Nitrospira sp.]